MQPNQKKIKKATRIESVMNSALWHLGQRDLSEGELISKLRNKTDNEIWIRETVEKLRDLNYLKSDAQFSQLFAERAFSNEYGAGYIHEKLKTKGINDAVIQDAICNVQEKLNIDEQTILNQYINQHYHDFSISKEKLTSKLQKRGFGYSQVNEAIKQHACTSQLQTQLEIKAQNVDLEKEILKYAQKGKGITRIRQELRQRKIDITQLETLIEKLTHTQEIDFYASCLAQLEKKSFNLTLQKERAKAYAMLSRKGFSSEEIQFAMNEIKG